MPTNIKEIAEKVIPFTLLWWFGWIIAYTMQVMEWTKFSISILLMNILIAAFVWYITWLALPDSWWDAKFAIVWWNWFIAYQLLSTARTYLPQIFKNQLIKRVNNITWDKMNK